MMRLPWGIRKNINKSVGSHPDGWEKFNWQLDADGRYIYNQYKIYEDEKYGFVIAERRNVNYGAR